MTTTNRFRSARVLAVAVPLVALLLVLQLGSAAAQEPGTPAAKEAPAKVFKMEAENWKWIPNKIRVVEGDRVVLEIKGRDAPHRFDLKAYGLKVKIPQDETARVEFVASKVGEFTFFCGRPCGDGCPRMTGTLYVVPREDEGASD